MKKYFYDIHCHAMNMSHPNFLAFMKRFEDSFFDDVDKLLKKNRFITFMGVNFLLFQFMFFKKFSCKNLMDLLQKAKMGAYPDRAKNLLAAMENDTGSLFLMMEECIKEHVMKENRLIIGDKHYDKVVLTPLIMDFGSPKAAYRNIHYNRTAIHKPIDEQIVDILNGIKNYSENSPYRIFEIYPFIGINTQNYTLNEINDVFETYFKDYNQSFDRASNQEVSESDVHTPGSNIYAGVKLYPPLGFDPWPDEPIELEKVKLLYETCQIKRIPITCHCSDEGFCVVSKEEMERLTSPLKWETVLKEYSSLKINLAHFGKQDKSTEWQKGVLNLIKTFDNVYTDISHRGFEDNFYKTLKNVIQSFKDASLQKKIKERILFGSDFMINLLKIDSYCEYFNIFMNTEHFSPEEKDYFCSINPSRFLFGSRSSHPIESPSLIT